MTPLLPNPDYYIANLITMTSSEATRLWRRAIKDGAKEEASRVLDTWAFIMVMLSKHHEGFKEVSIKDVDKEEDEEDNDAVELK